PGEPTPITPVTPPVAPATPATPATPVTPAPAPHPQPAPAPAPSPGPQPVTPATPGPSGPATPGTPGGEPAPHVKPAALAEQPGVPGQHAGGGTQSGPAHADESAASVTPAAASGVPGARAAAAAPSGTAVGAGARSSVGTAAASGAGSHAATGRAPVATSDKAAAPSTRAASARTAPPARPPSTDHIDKPDRSESADDGTPVSMIPVSAARAARDAATAAASARQRGRGDALRLARRIAAALNASDNNAGDYGFFWITAVTTDGSIVVANSYGLAYIPDGMELPNKVYLASADHAIPVDEIARCATYPVLAVQAWAAFHDMTLRAVIGTAEQLASSDPGVAKIVLEPDDIPESGKMTGRSRLEVVDPSAAAQLADTTDQRLLDLLPPAPVDVNPPGDERHMLWFELMKPMTSTATGREAAHLRAFRAYAAHSQEIALHQAHTATDAAVQRVAVADWLYWQYVTGLLDRALAAAC
ncbi:type VII secretion system ESX-1 associated protein EspK, partial [Mycobacterium tuberculosis]